MVLEKVQRILQSDVKKINARFSKVKNTKTGANKKGYYKIKLTARPQKKPKPTPILVPDISLDNEIKEQPENIYVGKAGECAVMAELLFRLYNVNSMLVDDGVDVVASKNNVFYYIQVKTSNMRKNGRFHFTIDDTRFNQFIGTQMRYILVGRCTLNNVDSNMFFVFSSKDIQNFIYNRCAKEVQNGISIKIEIENATNLPIIYDDKRADISFYMNNFNL